jgi:hypothetical protein
MRMICPAASVAAPLSFCAQSMNAQRHFSFDKLLVLPLALLLTLLQALSPFVHAHYGNSFEHGWHMHLLPSRTLQPAAEHRAATDAAGHHYTQSLSTDESAEVDMEQGLPPDDSNAIALPATMWEGAAEACSSGASL